MVGAGLPVPVAWTREGAWMEARTRSPFIPGEASTDDDGSLIGFQSGVFENYNAPIGLDFYRMPG